MTKGPTRYLFLTGLVWTLVCAAAVTLHLLLGMQCHAMQGSLFSRPLPFEDFCRYLESSPSV